MSDKPASTWGAIDDATIAEARTLMRVPLRRERMQWVETATADAIRQFADGIGDDNPLWRDPGYAAATRWQSLLAPPAFLYAVDATIVAPKLPGVQWIYAGTRWRWFDVIRANQSFAATAQLVAMEEKQGRRFGRWVLQTGEIEYRAPSGELLAVAEGRVARTPRASSGDKAKRRDAKDAKDAKQDAAAEETTPKNSAAAATPNQATTNATGARAPRRGGEPRFFEDVGVGSKLGPDPRPLSLVDIYRWYVGAQGALHYGGAHGDAVRYRHRHDDFEINADTGAKDSAARGHFSAREGRSVGMGGAYDVGLHRISWIAAMLTDWMGNDGFLAELNVDVLRPNLVGDTTTLQGEVTATLTDPISGQGFVEIAVEARNQHDAVTASGRALVALPSRTRGPVELPLFARDPNGFAQLTKSTDP